MDPSSGDVKPVIRRQAVGDGAAEPALLRGWREFMRSGLPARFLCFEKGEWVDVAGEAVARLRQAFQERRAAEEAAYHGRTFLFDFLGMLRIDMATSESTALGWIDDHGGCFFPAPVLAGMKRKRGEEQAGDQEDEAQSSGVEERSDESRGSGGAKRARDAWGGAAKLEESDSSYNVVSELFLRYGMAQAGAVITAVRKVATGMRALAFKKQKQLIADSRGADEATPKFAWYGAPAKDVSAAVAHGFTRPNALLLGASAHGDGMHLSLPQFPHRSAALAHADETGEAHIVLCRVLVGRQEVIPAGSAQSSPSGDDYDTAVDNMENPQWYIVWDKDMNTRIFPEYLVSFKCPKLQKHGMSGATSKLKKPSPMSRDMFPTLLAEIQKIVPSYKCQIVQATYRSFKNRQMKKDQFIKFLRNYIGDKVLTTVAKKMRGDSV